MAEDIEQLAETYLRLGPASPMGPARLMLVNPPAPVDLGALKPRVSYDDDDDATPLTALRAVGSAAAAAAAAAGAGSARTSLLWEHAIDVTSSVERNRDLPSLPGLMLQGVSERGSLGPEREGEAEQYADQHAYDDADEVEVDDQFNAAGDAGSMGELGVAAVGVSAEQASETTRGQGEQQEAEGKRDPPPHDAAVEDAECVPDDVLAPGVSGENATLL